MYNLTGCLLSIFLILLIFFLIKELWWFFVGLILIAVAIYYGKLIYETIKNKQLEKEMNYNPQMGEVYKVCPYCNTKVKVTETTCPNCKRALN
jgi:hypothetical protein